MCLVMVVFVLFWSVLVLGVKNSVGPEKGGVRPARGEHFMVTGHDDREIGRNT